MRLPEAPLFKYDILFTSASTTCGFFFPHALDTSMDLDLSPLPALLYLDHAFSRPRARVYVAVVVVV